MIATLAIAVLELLAVVWACALLYVNAGLRAEIRELRAELARDEKPANSGENVCRRVAPLRRGQ